MPDFELTPWCNSLRIYWSKADRDSGDDDDMLQREQCMTPAESPIEMDGKKTNKAADLDRMGED